VQIWGYPSELVIKHDNLLMFEKIEPSQNYDRASYSGRLVGAIVNNRQQSGLSCA
jgi:hypothetical protein